MLDNPVNQTAEVLYALIYSESIDRVTMMRDYGVLNLTARIANLRNLYHLVVICEEIQTKNKFGRPIIYGKWRLVNKEVAKSVYLTINVINKNNR